jgi:hypothetical protein
MRVKRVLVAAADRSVTLEYSLAYLLKKLYGVPIMKSKLILATTWLTSEPWRMRALVTAALLAMSLAAGGGIAHAGEASSGGGG